MDVAPIILFTYNRPWHTEQTLLALEKNELSSQSKLFVFSDGPKEDASIEDLESIESVRRLVTSRRWCKEVNLVKRESNVGLATNVISGITEIIEQYGRVIVLEDDIITSRYFLNYMNDALVQYEREEKIFGATGYTYPNNLEIVQDTFFLPVACSWSYATWKDRWQSIDWDVDNLLNEVTQTKDSFDFGGYKFFEMLKNNSLKKNDSWAIRFYAAMYLQSKWFLFPRQSLVENIGFDDSGTHCVEDDYFSKVKPEDNRLEVGRTEISLPTNLEKHAKTFFTGGEQSSASAQKKPVSKIFKKINTLFNNKPK